MTEERKEPEKEPEKAKEEEASDEREDDEEERDDEEAEESDEEHPGEGVVEAGPRSHRLKLWLLVAAAIVVAMVLLMKPKGGAEGGAGSVVNADLTLITSDKNDVDCVAPKGLDAYHCGFSEPNKPFQVEEKLKLRPYFTIDRRLFLVPGLFTQPQLEERAKSEPPDKPRDQLKRFTAKCQLKLLGELDGVRYRWLQTADWSAPAKVQVAQVVECKVEG